MNDTIVIFRLVSGEEVMGCSVMQTDTTFLIKKPVLVKIYQQENGQAGIGFLPFLMLAKDQNQIPFAMSSMVTYPVEVDTELAEAYIQQTSDIILPKQSGIIL